MVRHPRVKSVSAATVGGVDVTFSFSGELFEWEGQGAWFFVTLPRDLAEDIRDLELPRRGFGSVKVKVRTGGSEWQTSLFPDRKSGSYLLPVKKAIRRAEGIDEGDLVDFEIDLTVA
ncbi:MAG TPA: DUF1905 domain-containing protein [Acidimicrobiales bacterium]|nr:DUF1905 domain-containing protein [Acidimicrobiales bacterium]